ncbi:hypothetical protein [Moorena producens]|uniref:hypothetical protein n=1 Tax=Moorena producens TaxID=1155739 RepID=UPI001313DAD5|nr:hypothetical protein [Moorena producens]
MTTYKLTTLAYWPRYANNLQPYKLTTLAYWPRYGNNLGLLATLREQLSTF